MAKKRVIISVSIVALLLLVLGAVFLYFRAGVSLYGNNENSQPEVKGFELLSYVPSDACGVICCEKLGVGMETLFDSDNVFRDLSFGKLSDERMVISYHYMGELVPMIVVASGRGQNTPQDVLNVIAEAEALSLQARYIQAPARSGRKNVLMICSSYSVLDAAQRHLESGTSVMEVEGLVTALEKAPSKGDVVIFRNDAIANLLPKDFLSKHVSRKSLISFIKGYADWTVMHLTKVETAGRGEYLSYDLRTVHSDDFSDLAGVYEQQGYGDSKVVDMLPQGTMYVVDQSITSMESFIDCRKKHLDATASLNKFNNNLAQMKKTYGIDPVSWAIELDIREVARVKWKSEEVILVRPAKPQVSHDVKANSRRGFVSTVFGSAYSIADESYSACIGNWIVYGSKDAVKHFISSEKKQKTHSWPTKNVKAVVLADDCQIGWTKSGLEFQVYRTY